MTPTNAQIADLLRRFAGALKLEGADRFKVKAYHRAAETLEAMTEQVAKLVSNREDLKKLPGIGTAISAKIEEIVRTGKLPQLERSISRLPPELMELATKPALDPKRILRVYKKLGISSLAELRGRLDRGEIRETFGARMDFHIRQGLDERPRMLLWAAEKLALQIEEYLKAIPGLADVARLGSLRRKQETVGDLSFLVSGKSAAAIFKRFAKFGAVQSSEARGKSEMVFKLSAGRAVTLVWSAPEDRGLTLLLRTGSAQHVEGLRRLGKKRRLTLSIQSLGVAAAGERELYTKLRLPFIEPELREGRGEVEAAATGTLPHLVCLEDLRGDLHMHTTASDGGNSLEEMAGAAQAKGYAYIAITDHSQSLKITNGLTEKRLFEQNKAIDRLNARLKGLVILKSAEVDILEDGRLDYSEAALKELDLTVCSIHSRFGLDPQRQTERIMRAMDNRYFNILGHATGRLLLKREGYELDMGRIINHAAERGCYFEINSSPNRLDLSDEHARLAKDAGLKIAINTDAHSTHELSFISAGLNQARRAWLERDDVPNTFPLAKLRTLLRR